MLREVRDSFAPGARTATATDHSVARSLQRVVQRQHRDLLVVGSSRRGRRGGFGSASEPGSCSATSSVRLPSRHAGSTRIPGRFAASASATTAGPRQTAALALAASIAVAAGAGLLVQTVVDDRLPELAWSSLGGVLGLT